MAESKVIKPCAECGAPARPVSKCCSKPCAVLYRQRTFTPPVRFWLKVPLRPEPPSECWMWTGAVNRKGYGSFNPGVNEPNCVAHRYAWTLVNGPVPEGKLVLHRCDTPGCVRVSHLFVGSAAENTADMMSKQRNKFKTFSGEEHYAAKLTEDSVRLIRASSESLSSLARKLGVSKPTVGFARSGATWKHVQ